MKKTTVSTRKWWLISLSFIICHLSFSPCGAQTFTQKLQKSVQGEGQVRLHQDKAIEDLVNGASGKVTTTTTTTPTTTPKPTHPVTVAKEKKTEKAEKAETPKSETTAEQLTDSTNMKKPTHTMRTVGYRVQAFAGGNSRRDRQKAEQTGNQLRSLFPGEQVYTHFYSPRWICRIGNYRTYEEALKMLEEVKKLGYSSATIVKGKISVAY